LINDLENLLGKKVDISIENALKPHIKTEILKEAKSL
jgi:predicted nucleotidyltransferase